MNCPLELYKTGTLGTVDYYAACECTKMCQYTQDKYMNCGFVAQFTDLGATTTNTVNIVGKACKGSFPLVAESTGALVTNANLTAGTIYRIYPVTVSGLLRGIVQGL